jgi:formylglycine-generating enzyme required for sulfatase activity
VIDSADLSALLSAYAPLSGHANKTVKTVLDIGTSVSTTVGAWILCSFNTAATNLYGQMYYNSTSKIFGPNDAGIVQSGENSHNNNYACSYVSWYGGTAYSIWLGGMLPTLGQWYYGGCATNSSGGKATPTSHYPSPVVKTTALGSSEDAILNPLAWYSSNSGSHVHEVAKKAPNQVGLYDVSGNLYEWCLDWHQSGNYSGGQDGVSVASSSYRVFRGGSWGNSPSSCSLGFRNDNSPGNYYNTIGFRAAVAP